MVLNLRRSLYLVISLLIVWGTSAVIFISPTASAAQITNRSLTLQAGTSNGGSDPGGVVNHFFQFTVPSTTSVQSVQFLYCTTADGTCVPPTGMTASGATVANQSAGLSGFSSINTSTANAPYIYSASPTNISGAQSVTLDSVTNPTSLSTATFYVRISTFTSNNASGSAVDTGNVAASIAAPILLSGQMPESLVFCDGGTISETNGVPDCTTATSASIQFTSLFSPTAPATATSQMAASTNAGSGYVISINGSTLTSGSNTITAMASANSSEYGVSQFGTNLEPNTAPAAGIALTPSSDGVNYKGEALTGYNTANSFKFNSGDDIADSADGGAGGSNAQIYTNTYIVNVPGNQPAGTYTTTLTYICTPTY